MHGIFRGIAFTSFLALSACSAMLKEPPGITYAESVLQLGITPVYPPREDIQVGDIYAVQLGVPADEFALNALVDTRDLTKQINSYVKSRYRFADGTANGQRFGPPANDKRGAKLFEELEPDALPIASFPEIEVNSGISIGVGGQPTGLLASFGLVAAKTLRMRLRYEQVTSYEVWLRDGIDALDDFCDWQARETCTSDELAWLINQKHQLPVSDPNRAKAAGIMMVTKVYLARSITYTFSDAQLAAAFASVVSTSGATGTTSVVTQEMLDKAIDKDKPEILTALASVMDAASRTASSGGEGALRIAGVTASTVSINESFVRPVVIGYEAVSRPAN